MTILATLTTAFLLNAVLAAAAWRLHTVSPSGAVAGALIGILIYIGSGVGGWLMLGATFAAAAGSSRLGWTRKALLGIEQNHGGRRGPRHAWANCGVATCAAAVALAAPYRQAALLALVTAMTAAGSDTVASEVGKAFGRRTYLVTRLTRVTPGTPGAISLVGTAAGLLAAVGLSLVGVGVGLISAASVWPCVIGATAGAFAESLLGATLEPRGIVTSDTLNLVNTAIAALVALMIVAF